MTRAARLLAIALTLGCVHGTGDGRSEPLPTLNGRQVQIAPGVSLEVVDWGGRGTPLVFLAGLGNTAHVFDGFAPRFRDDFRVIGITRRGFGASAGAAPASELDTLTTDLNAVLDTLGLTRVVLVGHSIAGEEMTRWAELFPSRCAGLIYLDAAYDRSHLDLLSNVQPAVPGPRTSAGDFNSFASVRAFHARVMGVREPESEIRATSRFDARDQYRGEVTPGRLKARVASGSRVARYDTLRCRTLAIYAVPDSIVDVVPYYAELSDSGRTQADSLLRFVESVVAQSRAELVKNPHAEVIDLHGGNHFIFLQQPDTVARIMRTFLAGGQRPPAPD